METALVQRRTLRLLFVTQIISGIGMGIGGSVGALFALATLLLMIFLRPDPAVIARAAAELSTIWMYSAIGQYDNRPTTREAGINSIVEGESLRERLHRERQRNR